MLRDILDSASSRETLLVLGTIAATLLVIATYAFLSLRDAVREVAMAIRDGSRSRGDAGRGAEPNAAGKTSEAPPA